MIYFPLKVYQNDPYFKQIDSTEIQDKVQQEKIGIKLIWAIIIRDLLN